MANTERLKATLDFIRANPESWNQEDYFYCFAGLTVRQEHGDVVARDMIGGLAEDYGHTDIEEIEYRCPLFFEARDLLGLSNSEAESLFYYGNPLSRIEYLVQLLTEEGEEVEA